MPGVSTAAKNRVIKKILQQRIFGFVNFSDIHFHLHFSTVSASSDIPAALPYARISPPLPSNIPPKYLTTTTTAPQSSRRLIAFSSGNPAVPRGSPASLHFSMLGRAYAKATCLAFLCSLVFSSINALASSSEFTLPA